MNETPAIYDTRTIVTYFSFVSLLYFNSATIGSADQEEKYKAKLNRSLSLFTRQPKRQRLLASYLYLNKRLLDLPQLTTRLGHNSR